MSKNILYGHKRWYPTTIPFKKSRIKRVLVNNKYSVKFNERDNNETIDNTLFIINLIKFKAEQPKLGSHIHNGNILFKLKKSGNLLLCGDKVVHKVYLLKKSNNLKTMKNITRKKIENELVNNFSKSSVSKFITIENKKIILIPENEIFDCERKELAIQYRELTNDSLWQKRALYDICVKINQSLAAAVNFRQLLSRMNNRNYITQIREDLKKEVEDRALIKILAELKSNYIDGEENKNYFKFLLNINGDKKISENKRIFISKLFNMLDLDIEITSADIATFLLGELCKKNLIKRIEPKVALDEKIKASRIKTYIYSDNHISYKQNLLSSPKIQTVKYLLQSDIIETKFEKIFDSFDVPALQKKIDDEIKDNRIIDTNLFKVLKDHYKTTITTPIADDEKIIYKKIYRSLKGRINNLIEKNSSIGFGSIEHLKKQIKISLKQYLLETLLYVGRKSRISNKNMTMANLHAEEELGLEIIALFSSCNLFLNSLLEQCRLDFFKSTAKNSIEDNLNNISINESILLRYKELLTNLDFLKLEKFSENFIRFLSSASLVRAKIVHGGMALPEQLGEDFNDTIEKTISKMLPADCELCQNLNLDIIFSHKALYPEIFQRINSIEAGNDELIKYFPSFSKFVPKIKKVIFSKIGVNYLASNNILLDSIMNAAIYVNKILYKKMIMSESSEFRMKLQKANFDIAEKYLQAQIAMTKGNKYAIRRFQKTIVDMYVNFLIESSYNELLDFSTFTLSYEDFIKSISSRNSFDEKYLLINTHTFQKLSNFDCIIAILCILNDNIYVNKIRNRLLATDIWLSENKYNNLIEAIDLILAGNREKIDIDLILGRKKVIDDLNILDSYNVKSEIIKQKYSDLQIKDFVKIQCNDTKICKLIEHYKANALDYYNTLIKISSLDDGKYKDIYYQANFENIIYRKNIFEATTSLNSKSILDNFQLPSLSSIDTTPMFNNSISKKIVSVDFVLNMINDKTKGMSQEYKAIYINKIKNIPTVFAKEVESKYTSYEDFYSDYQDICKYKKTVYVLNFGITKKINHYIADLNWKLLIQIMRLERDIHCIVVALIEMGILPKLKTNGNNDSAFAGTRDKQEIKYNGGHYLFDKNNYNLFQKCINKIGINLDYSSLKTIKEIRNIIAHFDLVQKTSYDKGQNCFVLLANSPNSVKLYELIDKISDTLRYRTKYNNSTYNIVFEIFKKNVDINFNYLKRKFKLQNTDINSIISPKEISVFKLPFYLDEEIDLIKKLLGK